MRSWRDEWKSARLHLRLRAHQLFHGESVTLLAFVEAVPGTQEADDEALKALVRRWQVHCEGATTDVKVVTDDSAGRRRESSGASPHPTSTPRHGPRVTLFHQETELSVVRGDACNDGHGSSPPERFLLALRAQFELKVRSEFWDRPLSLVLRITPKDSAKEMAGSATIDAAPEGTELTDDWFTNRLLPLIREDSTPLASLTKRLEYPIKVVNPLQVQVDTRPLIRRRVGITVNAHNTRDDVVVEVLDLQLHLSEALTGSIQTSDTSKERVKPPSRRYELVEDTKAPFPVLLLAQERCNFLFVLAPTQPPIKEREAADSGASQLQYGQPRGSVDGSVGREDGPEHALLTLTWRTQGTGVLAITEQHTIIWSPFALAEGDKQSTSSALSMLRTCEWRHFVVPQTSAGKTKPLTASALSFVALRHDSALHVAFISPARRVGVGEVVTACVAITNRSSHSTFDLTLVVPSGGDACATWISFEASHHLGLVRPGKSVRKSVHLCALQAGAPAPHAVALVDALTRTCFYVSVGG